jgi:hypothetical protein
MDSYRRKTYKNKDAQIINEENPNSIILEDLSSFSDNT